MSIDTAEWVLNKCVLEGHRLRESSIDDKMSDGVDGSDDKDDTDEPGRFCLSCTS